MVRKYVLREDWLLGKDHEFEDEKDLIHYLQHEGKATQFYIEELNASGMDGARSWMLEIVEE